jgi:hypothetical protein
MKNSLSSFFRFFTLTSISLLPICSVGLGLNPSLAEAHISSPQKQVVIKQKLIAELTQQPKLNYSETQTSIVSCSSRGQICDKSFVFNVRPSMNRDSITLTAPLTHCSAVRYEVMQAGFARQKTQFLQPGEDTQFPVNLSAGSDYRFIIRAIGVKGGCNTGRLVSWGVKVSVDNG